MSFELLFTGLFFTMIGLILIFSKTPRSKLEESPSPEKEIPEPVPVARPPEKLFAFDKIIIRQKTPPLNSELFSLDLAGGLLFYISQASPFFKPLTFGVYVNQAKPAQLLRVQKDSILQIVPTFSFYDADNRCIGQIEKDVWPGKKSRWYLLNTSGERIAHVEKDSEAVAWSKLSEETRHAEKYDIFSGALIAGRFIRDDYDPDKYILDFSQDNGEFDRRLALCIAVVLMATRPQ